MNKEIIEDLHRTWRRESGHDIPLNQWARGRWEAWLEGSDERGQHWGPPDIAGVCRYIVNVRHRPLSYLGFWNFTDPANFAQNLSEATSWMRRKKYPEGLRDVLRATGRPDTPRSGESRSAGECVRGMRFQELAQKMRRAVEEGEKVDF